MALTTAQKATLVTNILATPEANTLYVDGNLSGLADYYNAIATSDFWVWRRSVTKNEFVTSVSHDGTTFMWTGNGFIGRSQGELTAWHELFNGSDTVNPSLANVRAAFGDIFSGAGNAAANRAHLLAVARRLATRLEQLFASGAGTAANPAVMAVEGPLQVNDLIGL